LEQLRKNPPFGKELGLLAHVQDFPCETDWKRLVHTPPSWLGEDWLLGEKPELTPEKALERPAWTEPKNGTNKQIAEWRLHMIMWTCHHLTRSYFEARKWIEVATREYEYKMDRWKSREELMATAALEAAGRGDMEPLRKKYPHLAKYLHPAPRERGNPGRPRVGFGAKETAEWGVIQIRKRIWPEHFKKGSRRGSDGPSAELIVAIWLSPQQNDLPHTLWKPATEDDVIRWTKPSGKHRTPRPKSRGK
jgi:hypothetical protein